MHVVRSLSRSFAFDQFPYATKLALAETEAMGIKSEIGIGIGDWGNLISGAY